jgi:hypothetical protein
MSFITCPPRCRRPSALEPIITQAHAHVAGLPADVDGTGWLEGRKVLAELIPGTAGVRTTDFPTGDRFVERGC